MAKFSEGSVGNEGSGASDRSAPEAAQLEAQIAVDNRLVARRRQSLAKTVELAGSSPVEAQVAFIKGLLDNPGEARKFTESPKDYAVEHGVLLSPDIVRDVTNGLLFDVNVDGVVGKLGGRAAQDFLDMRSNASVAAVPAAVAAGAAAVAAAAAVVEAVVTVVRTSRVTDLAALKGLGPNGIRMPGGGKFEF